MPEDDLTQPGSSPASDAGADSSPAAGEGQAPPSGQTPPPTSQEEAKPWNMPPADRWDELRRERDEARRQATDAMEVARRAQASQQPPAPAAPADLGPWEGLVNHPEPETARYWQSQKRIQDHYESRHQQDMAQVRAQQQHLAVQGTAMYLDQFRRENPDIQPGSQEERAIAERIGQGYPLEEAKRIVMYDVLQRRLSQHSSQETQRRQQQKQHASPEAGPGMPASSGGSHAKGSFAETMDAELQAEGL